MSFMQPEVYEGDAYVVETHIRTEIVPVEVYPGAEKNVDLQDFTEGGAMEPLDPPEIKHGWLCRMQAPGYLDATEWSLCDTEQEAYDLLDELYGLDEE